MGFEEGLCLGDGSDWKKRFYRVWPENEEAGARKCRTLSHVVLEQLMGSEFAIVLSCLALSPTANVCSAGARPATHSAGLREGKAAVQVKVGSIQLRFVSHDVTLL